MRRRVGLAAGIGLAAAAAFIELAGAPAPGGPLAESVPSNAVTFPVRAGTPFTYGGLQLRNPGREPAILGEVRLEGASPGLRIQAAHVLQVGDTTGGLWFSYQRFPPPGLQTDRLHDVAGFEIAAGGRQPGDGVQVLLVLSVATAGRYEFKAVAVDYRAGGRPYRAVFPFAMRVCAFEADPDPCPRLPAAN